MNTDSERTDVPHAHVTGEVLKAAFAVSNALGCGFLKKVYENSLAVELRSLGLEVSQQVPVRVLYKNETVGNYVSDLVVESTVLVEVKATMVDHNVHIAQTLNYLKATGLPVALVLNFARPRLVYKRLVLGDIAETKDLRHRPHRPRAK